MEDTFQKYRRLGFAECRPYKKEETLDESVSISEADINAGSPKVGDMIARNPLNHKDQWLIAEDYFWQNFENKPVKD